MLKREQWIDLAREVDWQRSYVAEDDAFPIAACGAPTAPRSGAASGDELARATLQECTTAFRHPEPVGRSVHGRAVRAPFVPLDAGYRSAVKLHAAGLPLAEFGAAVAGLRAARFARSAGFRAAAVYCALEALRRAQAPLLALDERVAADAQFDWARRFLHSEHWFAIATRHLLDDLLLAGDPIEVAVASGFVFEASFKDAQAAAFAALAGAAGDGEFEVLRRALAVSPAAPQSRVGRAALEQLVLRDRGRAQYLVDKWFWRCWPGFAIVTGSAVDYLAPLAQRGRSFKELMLESVAAPFLYQLAQLGLSPPWYWPELLAALDSYHHMAYASLYTYRRTLWFDPVLPGPLERRWLRGKYPHTWDDLDAVWERVAARWNEAGPGVEWYAHATAPVVLCNLCQLPLWAGTPGRNAACTRAHDGGKYVFCSEPCAWIFQCEPARYAAHRDLIARCMAGDAPGNPIALLLRHFGLSPETWGNDAYGGHYPWLASSVMSGSPARCTALRRGRP